MPEDVWNFHIGGYQVCEKWLKDRQAKGGKNPRPGRVLTQEDLAHYQKIVVALEEAIRLMQEIDEVIEPRKPSGLAGGVCEQIIQKNLAKVSNLRKVAFRENCQ